VEGLLRFVIGLLMDQWPFRWCLRRGGRDRQCNPHCVAFRSVLGGKILVGFQIQVALMRVADREQETDLWADAGHTSLKIAELCAGAAVAGELLKEIAGKPDMHVLAHELRCGPVDMKVQVRVDEVVRQASDDGKFVSRFWIEIGVAGARIHGDKTEAEIGKARIVIPLC
jgi:hypothetical protein